MKFCPKCGKEVVEGAKFCLNCGEQLVKEQQPTQPAAYYQAPNQSVQKVENKSSLGKVAMIFGIISISCVVTCCCSPVAIITGPISIILAAIYMAKHEGQGAAALTGLVLGIVSVCLVILFIAIYEPFMEALEQYVREYCYYYPNSEECEIYKEAFPKFFD